MNTFGRNFRITSFGESHGPALGVVIDGCPAGVEFDEKLLQKWLERRRPGTSAMVSARQEPDTPEILSGIYNGRTLGTPITVIVRNTDARSQDYENMAPRIGHADDVWSEKFGHTDPRGGGRASGRETLARVIAGAFAQMALRQMAPEMTVKGFARKIGPLELAHPNDRTQEIEELLSRAKEEGQSYGGIAAILVEQPPPNLGQPVFHKLKSDLAAAMMSVGATNSFHIGESGSEELKGTEFHADFHSDRYGGIRGGISTGENIYFEVGFKPTSSIKDVAKKGRHDPCIIPRAIPVLEAMTYLVLIDHILWSRLDRV